MPRRRALTESQRESLLALPAIEASLIRHWTLIPTDQPAIERRRGGHSQLGYALQLCAFRYPGRLLRPGEAIPETALHFVAGQLRISTDALAAYAARPQTRREQRGSAGLPTPPGSRPSTRPQIQDRQQAIQAPRPPGPARQDGRREADPLAPSSPATPVAQPDPLHRDRADARSAPGAPVRDGVPVATEPKVHFTRLAAICRRFQHIAD